MKKYIVIALLLLTVAATACGGSPAVAPTSVPVVQPTTATQPTSAPQATTAKPTTAPAPTTEPGGGGLVEVQFWHAQSQSQQQALNGLIDQFNSSHPGIKVTGTYQGTYGDIYKKVTAALAAGSPPDMAIAYQNDIANYIKSDAVIPLDDMMKNPQTGFTDADLKDIFPSFIDHYPQYGNKVYSMAFMRSLEVMYYNADLLKAAGFDKPPATWDDFMNVCAKVNKPPDVYCHELNPDASRFAGWVFSRGGDLISADGKKVTFDQKAGLDSLQWEADMFKNKYATLIGKAFQDQTDFSLGKIVFAMGSTAGLPYYDKAVKDAGKTFKWDIAPLPHSTPNPSLDAYGPSVTIFKTTSAKQQAAFTFLKWLMDKDPNATWVKATAYYPARQSTKDALADYIKANPRYGNSFDWLQYGRGEPQVAAWNPIRGYILDALNAVANGKATPADALKTAVDKSNVELAK